VTEKLFESALGIASPWFVSGVEFKAHEHVLWIQVDFAVGSRFAVPGDTTLYPVHDTVSKHYRHLNFFQHECVLRVRTPRVKLPDGSVKLVEPAWSGKLSGFTLLFEALVLTLCREMTFAAVARIVNISAYKVTQMCTQYVESAVALADYSAVRRLAFDETSRARGHHYVTIMADAEKRKVLFVAEGRDAQTIEAAAANLRLHQGRPSQIEAVSIDMSPPYIKGVTESFPAAQLTFDKFHVIAHASTALDETRRFEQKTDASLKGLRWALLKDRSDLTHAQRADLDACLTKLDTHRTARAWVYREQLRDILNRKQVYVVRRLLTQWCTNVMRSKVEPMKKVARMIREHFEGIVAWVETRQTNGFLEAINGLFQAAKRKARGYGRFRTIRTVIFLIAGKLDFSKLNPYVSLPT
jgi:transposase